MGQQVASEFPVTDDPLVNVPIRSAMWDGDGADDLGNLTRPWVMFFQKVGAGGGGGSGSGPAGPPGLPGAPGVSGSYQVAR
jgi:hypothetical protein